MANNTCKLAGESTKTIHVPVHQTLISWHIAHVCITITYICISIKSYHHNTCKDNLIIAHVKGIYHTTVHLKLSIYTYHTIGNTRSCAAFTSFVSPTIVQQDIYIRSGHDCDQINQGSIKRQRGNLRKLCFGSFTVLFYCSGLDVCSMFNIIYTLQNITVCGQHGQHG